MVQIRRPTLHDLNECALLDPSYVTHRVWQMHLDVEPNDIQILFQLVSLPRPLTVECPPEREVLTKYWQRGDCMLTAREDHGIVGFLHMVPDLGTQIGLLRTHVVAAEHRRQGIGDALLRQAMQWGRDRNLRSLRVQVTTKNHPAVSFYMTHGFLFSGFTERLYSDQEILLDLARTMR